MKRFLSKPSWTRWFFFFKLYAYHIAPWKLSKGHPSSTRKNERKKIRFAIEKAIEDSLTKEKIICQDIENIDRIIAGPVIK
jgi:hypothetical protein